MDKKKAAQDYFPDEQLFSEIAARIREVERIELATPPAAKVANLLEQRTREAAERFEKRIVQLAEKLGIDHARARVGVRTLDTLDSLALEIADKLEWEHEGDAVERATEIVASDDWSPEGMAARYFNPNYDLANAYLSVRRISDAVERGDLLWALGDLAESWRRTLGSDKHQELSASNSSNAKAGWDWREEVLQFAFERRAQDLAQHPKKSRRQSVIDMQAEVVALYNERGAVRNVTMKDTNAFRNIYEWFTERGVK